MLQGEHAQLRDEHETAVEQLHMASASTRDLQVRPAAAAVLWPPGRLLPRLCGFATYTGSVIGLPEMHSVWHLSTRNGAQPAALYTPAAWLSHSHAA